MSVKVVNLSPEEIDQLRLATALYAPPSSPDYYVSVMEKGAHGYRQVLCRPMEMVNTEIDMRLAVIAELLSEAVVFNIIQEVRQSAGRDGHGASQEEVNRQIARRLLEACRDQSNYVAIEGAPNE